MAITPLPVGHRLMPDATQAGGFRFTLARALAAGGFANTYLASDSHFDDVVVIKELAISQLMARSSDGTSLVALPGKEDDVSGWVERTQREARLLNRIRHPGVVAVRATWTEGGTAYVALDFVDGTELRAEPVESEPGPLLAFALQLLDAIEAVHRAGLIHGDIKPSNIMVRPSGAPVLIDFGTARNLEQLAQRGLTTIAFTPGFAPPELVVATRASEVAPASDLYSWAMTVIGLFVSHPGTDGEPVDATVRLKLLEFGVADGGYGAETRERLISRGLPANWLDALMQCIRLPAAERPKDVATVREMIGAISAPSVAEGTPQGAPEQTGTATAAIIQTNQSDTTERPTQPSPASPPEEARVTAGIRHEAAPNVQPQTSSWSSPTIGVAVTAVLGAMIKVVMQHSGSSDPTPPMPEVLKEPAPEAPPVPLEPPVGVVLSPEEFLIGSPDGEAGRNDDEPQSSVLLTQPFWIARDEVTQELWSRVMGSNPSYFTNCGASCPVERVSWFDAVEFMNRLSRSEALSACYVTSGCTGTPGSGTVVGKQAPVWGRGDFVCDAVQSVPDCAGYRFPTEAEWEFAARGRTVASTYAGEPAIFGRRNAPELGKIAWYAGNAVVDYQPSYPCDDWSEREIVGTGCGPKAVGLLVPNPFGLNDILGNVWEWTGDWYGKRSDFAKVDPTGPETGDIRVFKGGSWRDDAVLSRAASRRGSKPAYRYASLGIRLVRSVGTEFEDE